MHNLFYFWHTNYERMVNVEIVYKICLTIAIIGAINWGLIGLLDFNLVDTLFGVQSAMSRIVYSLVGISGLVAIGILFEHFHEEDMH